MNDFKKVLDPAYKLTGVQVTGRILGNGASGSVLEVEYMKAKCAGKVFNPVCLQHEYHYHRCVEECRLLTQLRHPNIVQFLGFHYQPGMRAPILVMEFIPIDLTSCIEQYKGILPMEVSYFILHGVALGMFYLHSQTPPIIHRDLSSNNVLLTSDMTAKICDMGTARNFVQENSHMTRTPGTRDFMPPEAISGNYNTRFDVYSFGVMMMHVFTGQWPDTEQRDKFLAENNHPLIEFVRACVRVADERPYSYVIVEQLQRIIDEFPVSHDSRLDVMRQIEKGKKIDMLNGVSQRMLTKSIVPGSTEVVSVLIVSICTYNTCINFHQPVQTTSTTLASTVDGGAKDGRKRNRASSPLLQDALENETKKRRMKRNRKAIHYSSSGLCTTHPALIFGEMTEEHKIWFGKDAPFADLRKVLRATRVEWYNIGLELGIDPGTLDTINADNENSDSPFQAMLKQVLALK